MRVPEDKSVAAFSALPLSYAPMSGDGRSRTRDLSIDSRSIRSLRTGHPLAIVLPEVKLAGVRRISAPSSAHAGIW